MAVAPMFPLGTVLVPTMVLPLHVFEPRYRALMQDVVAGDGRFGVTLIERGNEVGGGDVRTEVGTMAQILEADELPDGRWVLAAVGTERLRVERWLPDDPYPKAEVALWPDPVEVVPPDAPDLDVVRASLRRALALSAELGEPAAPVTTEIADDAVLASYQMTALAPIGPADRQELLERPAAGARLTRLATLLDEAIELLTARLGPT